MKLHTKNETVKRVLNVTVSSKVKTHKSSLRNNWY